MSVVIWVAIGVLTGFIADKLMPGKSIGGISTTIIVGMLGALFGGVIGIFLGSYAPTSLLDINLGSLLSAMVGAYFTLVVFRMLSREYF